MDGAEDASDTILNKADANNVDVNDADVNDVATNNVDVNAADDRMEKAKTMLQQSQEPSKPIEKKASSTTKPKKSKTQSDDVALNSWIDNLESHNTGDRPTP